jgi:polyphosphate kinase
MLQHDLHGLSASDHGYTVDDDDDDDPVLLDRRGAVVDTWREN